MLRFSVESILIFFLPVFFFSFGFGFFLTTKKIVFGLKSLKVNEAKKTKKVKAKLRMWFFVGHQR